MPSRPARVLFVNGGILGLISFYDFLQQWLSTQSAIEAEHVMLTQRLTLSERIARRVICQRLWKDGWLGLSNLDAARFRAELHAGLLARRRIASLDPNRFDVIHFHRQATAYGSLDLMRQVPCVVSIDCTQSCVMDEARSALERRTYAGNVRIDGAIFRRAAQIVSTSQWAERSLRAMYPGCTTPVHVLMSPVLLEWFNVSWPDVRRERARRGMRPRVLFMGGDFPRKGGYDVLAAWRAGGFHERADLELVTNWPLETPLPSGVVQTRNVAPHTQQWAERWRAADLFVLPTHNEAFGLVFQEAAAAGIPAIGTNLNAIPEIVHHGETGLLVPPGDVGALGRAMHQLIASAELRDQLGRRAREVVEQVAAPDRYLARLTAIIEAARLLRRVS
jgi:glycosyltransferase involved in cell wall biosynthesis